MKSMTILMVFGLFLVAAEAFHVGSRTGASGVLSARAYSRDVMTAQNAKKKDRMELENIDGFEPKVDWDAEMKKLNERRGQSEDRPADVEMSELQYVQRKARNQAIRAYNKVVPQTTITPPAVPSFNKLKNKPLFWVAVIGGVSLLPIIFTAMAPPPTEYLV